MAPQFSLLAMASGSDTHLLEKKSEVVFNVYVCHFANYEIKKFGFGLLEVNTLKVVYKSRLIWHMILLFWCLQTIFKKVLVSVEVSNLGKKNISFWLVYVFFYFKQQISSFEYFPSDTIIFHFISKMSS